MRVSLCHSIEESAPRDGIFVRGGQFLSAGKGDGQRVQTLQFGTVLVHGDAEFCLQALDATNRCLGEYEEFSRLRRNRRLRRRRLRGFRGGDRRLRRRRPETTETTVTWFPWRRTTRMFRT